MTNGARQAEPQEPEGDYVRLDVFETVSTEAVPLPRDIFNGPRDRRYIPTPGRDGLMLWVPED